MAIADQLTFKQVGRNEPCPCGSGKKYKKCCLSKNEELRQKPSRRSLAGSRRTTAPPRTNSSRTSSMPGICSIRTTTTRPCAWPESCWNLFPRTIGCTISSLTGDLATGKYEEAFVRARRRWQVAQEEELFFQENGTTREKARTVNRSPISSRLRPGWTHSGLRSGQQPMRSQYPANDDLP